MGRWRIVFTLTARDDFDRLDSGNRRRIADKLKWLADNFDSIVPSSLEEPWAGFFKLRVGDWRIIYQPDRSQERIIVYRIDRRDKIYKRK